MHCIPRADNFLTVHLLQVDGLTTKSAAVCHCWPNVSGRALSLCFRQVMDQKAGRGATMGRGRGRGAVAAAGRGAFIQRDLSEFTCSWCGVKGDHFEKDCPAPDKLVKRIRCRLASPCSVKSMCWLQTPAATYFRVSDVL